MDRIETIGAKTDFGEENFKNQWERVTIEVINLIEKDSGLVDKASALRILGTTDFQREATKTWGDPHLVTTDDEKLLAKGALIRLKQRLDN